MDPRATATARWLRNVCRARERVTWAVLKQLHVLGVIMRQPDDVHDARDHALVDGVIVATRVLAPGVPRGADLVRDVLEDHPAVLHHCLRGQVQAAHSEWPAASAGAGASVASKEGSRACAVVLGLRYSPRVPPTASMTPSHSCRERVARAGRG